MNLEEDRGRVGGREEEANVIIDAVFMYEGLKK